MESLSPQEVILNGDSLIPTKVVDGIVQPVAPTTTEQRLARKNELTARGTLLMAFPDKHQLQFNIHKDAKSLMEAIEKRFGGNNEIKKVQKTLLKQQYENFIGSSSESLDQIHDRLQKLISQLEISDLEEQSLDDLFNNLKIYKAEVKSSSSTSPTTQKFPFMSSQNTNSTNESVSVIASVSTASTKVPVFALPNVDNLSDAVIYFFFTSQSNSPRLDNDDLKQIDANDLEEMDLKWQMAMPTIRARSVMVLVAIIEAFRKMKNQKTMPSWHSPPQVLQVLIMRNSQFDVLSYKTDLDYVKARLVVYQQNKNVFEEDIKLLKLDVMLRDNALVELRKKIKKAEKERDELKLKLENFQTSLKNLSQLLASQITNKTRYQSGKEYHAVPHPYTGTFMPPKSDLVFYDALTATKIVPHVFKVEPSTTKPHKDLSQSNKPSAHIIEDWVSDSEDESKGEPMTTQKAPSFVQPSEHVKTHRPSVKPVEHHILAENPRKNIPKTRGLRHSWNRKACFICKSLNYLIKDYDYYEKKMVKKPVWNHAMRINHQNSARITHPHSKKHVVSTAVLTSNPQQALKDKGVIDSGCSRHMIGNISYLSNFKEINGGYVAFGGYPKGGKITGKGKIRTGKLDFDDVYFVKELNFNLFSVSQMYDKKNGVLFTDIECIILSSDFKLADDNHVLLRVPKENNMYNVDLKNIVPLGDLTCLFEKATLDESNLWHRRLGHINFKTMNKLVKGNLVRGLPSKVFKNNHTCVACKKGKQHRASCKTKFVSSVCQPLQRLHMDLFGPTFVKSLNKKSYCLVVTDDYSRFSWVFFLATKDETSTILKTFITGIENQINHKIKREFSVARIPQQYRIAERKNRTLIEADSTMLADSLLPIPFWAESVNTACYVQNRVLVTKPHNKTPYELLLGRTHSIGFMRHFGCCMTILNTLAPLGNQPNFSTGIQENFDAGKAGKGNVQQYVFLPLWSSGSKDPQNIDADASFEVKEPDTNGVNAASTQITTIGPNSTNRTNSFSVVVSPNYEIGGQSSFVDPSQYPDDPNMLELEDITYSDDEEDVAPQTRSMKRMAKEQALKDPSWIEAMQEELLQFKMQKVLVPVDLPKGKRAIGSKWVFRNKKDKRGIVVKNKGRLVAQGHTQEEGIDYEEVFALVARIEAIRLFLAYASFMGFLVYQMDVKSTFLYETIEEAVYVRQPLGFEDPGYPDKTLFIKRKKGDILLVQVYVDDIIFGSTNKDLCKAFEKSMKDKFKMSLMGELTFFLGLQVKQKGDEIFISQDKYVAKILRKFGLTDGKSASTPIDTEKPLLMDPDVAYSNSDYARASLDRKSTTWGCQFLGCRLISWQCKKQMVVATLSTEAEYVTTASCCAQVLWIQNQLLDYGLIITAVSSKLMLFVLTIDVVHLMLLGHQSDASEGFEQIIDFLNASVIQYALLVNPTIYVSCIKQFWSSVLIKKTNDVLRLQALIDRRKVIINEDTVRQALRLDDVVSIDCLPNKEIFAELARIRVGKGFSRVDTPLFDGMLVPQQVHDDVAAVVEDEDDANEISAEPTLTLPTPATTPPPQQDLIHLPPQVETTPPSSPHQSPIAHPSSPPPQQPSQPEDIS
nr:Gag-Pol polyprotein [Tanacetum cinerariifolium]